jgi:hypothetical protein
MHYFLYFAVATPLVLGWLFYESATLPPQPPLFSSGYERIAGKEAAATTATNFAAISAPNKLAKNDTAATR